jgi:hypothetical protein
MALGQLGGQLGGGGMLGGKGDQGNSLGQPYYEKRAQMQQLASDTAADDYPELARTQPFGGSAAARMMPRTGMTSRNGNGSRYLGR